MPNPDRTLDNKLIDVDFLSLCAIEHTVIEPKLNPQQKQELISEWLTGDYTQDRLAKKWGVSRSLVSRLTTGLTEKERIYSKEDVQEIRYGSKYGNKTYAELSELYGGCSSDIRQVVKGRTYKDVEKSKKELDMEAHLELLKKRREEVLGRVCPTCGK